MDLTANEAAVVQELRKVTVAELKQLAATCDVSVKTVQRALAKTGYLTSLNFNARFVTLEELARFDKWGLWSVDQIRFSRHGNLRETLVKLIEQAPSGFTMQELEERVGTRVHNHLSQLIQDERVQRFMLARHAVYVSASAEQANEQEARRRTATAPPPADATAGPLPAGIDAITVIRVLLRLLEVPNASLASVARSLQARQIPVRADQVRHILDFYGVKKTTRGR